MFRNFALWTAQNWHDPVSEVEKLEMKSNQKETDKKKSLLRSANCGTTITSGSGNNGSRMGEFEFYLTGKNGKYRKHLSFQLPAKRNGDNALPKCRLDI